MLLSLPRLLARSSPTTLSPIFVFNYQRRYLAMTSGQQPRRFAPLAEGSGGIEYALPKLKGVVFDVDGTLCEPQTYMFKQMRDGVGVPPGEDILEYIYTLTASEQEVAMSKIRAIEREAMSSQIAQPGLLSLMEYLDSKKIPKGICTRNFDAPVAHLLEKFLPESRFHPIVTRDFRPPKPAPDGILHIASSMGFEMEEELDVKGGKKGDASQFIMVGDSIDDMTAGYRAGAATVLLVNPVNAHLAEHEHTDLCISRLDELIEILEKGFVGRVKAGEEETMLKERAETVLKEGKGEGIS